MAFLVQAPRMAWFWRQRRQPLHVLASILPAKTLELTKFMMVTALFERKLIYK
jgi:hypothetical protein